MYDKIKVYIEIMRWVKMTETIYKSNIEEDIVKHKIKDSIFTDLFADKKYLLQLYQALHPEDSDIIEEQITNITINNVLLNGLYNDLGFMVRDKLIVLVEAQSTWSTNIVVRALLYLSQTYHDYLKTTKQLLYSSKKVHLPIPELYVIFTGDRKTHPKQLSLSEEFFGGKQTAIDVKVNMVYDGREGDIINQYIIFTRVCNEQIKLHGRTRKAILETIRICKDKNILKEYLESREKEVVDIMRFLYDDDELMELYKESIRTEARDEGMREGMRENKTSTALRMLKAGKYDIEEIADISGLTPDEITKLEVQQV